MQPTAARVRMSAAAADAQALGTIPIFFAGLKRAMFGASVNSGKGRMPVASGAFRERNGQ